jgi:hypothetical protein
LGSEEGSLTSPETWLGNWSQGTGSGEIENRSSAAAMQVSKAIAMGWEDCVAEYAAAGVGGGGDKSDFFLEEGVCPTLSIMCK